MSVHSSLRNSGKDKKHRSVLKRYERLPFSALERLQERNEALERSENSSFGR